MAEKKVVLTLRLPQNSYEALRVLAFERRRSQHSILLEAIDLVLAKHGRLVRAADPFNFHLEN